MNPPTDVDPRILAAFRAMPTREQARAAEDARAAAAPLGPRLPLAPEDALEVEFRGVRFCRPQWEEWRMYRALQDAGAENVPRPDGPEVPRGYDWPDPEIARAEAEALAEVKLRRGRPPRELAAAEADEFCERPARGEGRVAACLAMNVAYNTFRRLLRDDEAFAAAVEAAEEARSEACEAELYRIATTHRDDRVRLRASAAYLARVDRRRDRDERAKEKAAKTPGGEFLKSSEADPIAAPGPTPRRPKEPLKAVREARRRSRK